MPSGINPYNIDYSESVITKDIPALPAKVKLMIKKAIMECLTVDPMGLGKTVTTQLKWTVELASKHISHNLLYR